MRQKKEAELKVPVWRSSQLRFAIAYILLIAVALLLFNTFPILASQDMVFKTKQVSLQNYASLISSTVAPLEELTTEDVDRVMQMLDDKGLARVVVTDSDGKVYYDTKDLDSVNQSYALMKEVVVALEGKDVFTSSYSDEAFRSSVASPIVYRNAIIGAVYLYDYDAEQGVVLAGLQNNLLSVSAVILVMSLVLCIVLSRLSLKRFGRLIKGISDLQTGDYSTRIEMSGRDEVSTLAEAFNDMTTRLEETDEVRRRFVSDASHELKTPLASIRLLTDSIIQNPGMDSETIEEFVQDIGSEADRLTRITEKLLALTRMDNGAVQEHSRIDLVDVLTDALHLLHPLAVQRGIKINLQLDQSCFVFSSSDEMYQVIFNLVENAIKYNVENGIIWVRLSKEKGTIIFSVSDTGVGIPEDQANKVFDRFYRVDKARSRETGGTGLGLSIVKDTVANNGGTIQLEPRVPNGSIFTVVFPAAKEEGEGK